MNSTSHPKLLGRRPSIPARRSSPSSEALRPCPSGKWRLPLLFACAIGIASGPLAAIAGEVVGWGRSIGTDPYAPATIPDVAKSNVKAIAAGDAHSLALKHNGTVVAWGKNVEQQANVPDLAKNHVKAIAAGGSHSLALRNDGTVVAWGDNADGQASVPFGLNEVKAIAAGRKHSLALKNDGTVVAWGGGATVPPVLNDGKDVKAIAAGEHHNLALRNDGTVFVWGSNGNGQINIPDLAKNDVKAIVAGAEHSLVLKNDGTVVAWGYDVAGQSTVPGGLRNVKAIAAGRQHSLALRNDGTVVAWGNNQNGQGNVPVGMRNALAVVGGGYFTLALRDSTPPTIRMTGPKKSGRYPSSRKIRIKGNATDDVGLARWQYKLNKGKWKHGGTLSGASATWKKRIGKVKAGRNTVQVRAYDWGGLVSKAQKRKVRLKRRGS